MPSLRTEVTEIVTGLAMLGVGDVDWALAERPAAMANVDDAHWERLAAARHDPAHAADFSSAWANGLAFLRATDGLRGRPPLQVEWKGPDKLPAVADVPADLRIDHVYLVSCKYLSKILRNSSPAGLFDGCLGERPADTVADWYALAAPGEYEDLWQAVRDDLPDTELPHAVDALDRPQRDALAVALRGKLNAPGRQGLPALRPRGGRPLRPPLVGPPCPTRPARERMLWRMLRLTGAPYFVLGSSGATSLRLRIDTPWDWRQRFQPEGLRGVGRARRPAARPLAGRGHRPGARRRPQRPRPRRGALEPRPLPRRPRGEGLPGHPTGRRARVLAAGLNPKDARSEGAFRFVTRREGWRSIFCIAVSGSSGSATTSSGSLCDASRPRANARRSASAGRRRRVDGHDRGHPHLAHDRIGPGDHRDLRHPRVLAEDRLDLHRVHVVATADEHLAGAAGQHQAAAGVDRPRSPVRSQPSPGSATADASGSPQYPVITAPDRRCTWPTSPSGTRCAGLVADLHLDLAARPPHRVERLVVVGVEGGAGADAARLGRRVADRVVGAEAPAGLFDERGRRRAAADHELADRREVALVEAGVAQEQARSGRPRRRASAAAPARPGRARRRPASGRAGGWSIRAAGTRAAWS